MDGLGTSYEKPRRTSVGRLRLEVILKQIGVRNWRRKACVCVERFCEITPESVPAKASRRKRVRVVEEKVTGRDEADWNTKLVAEKARA